jgi:hypothetical protein
MHAVYISIYIRVCVCIFVHGAHIGVELVGGPLFIVGQSKLFLKTSSGYWVAADRGT